MIWSFSTLNSNLVTGSEYFTSNLRAECRYVSNTSIFLVCFSLSQNLRKARKWVYLARSSFVVVALSFHPICCSLSFFRKSFRSRCRCCYAFLVLLPTTLCCCCFVFLKAHKKVTIFRRTELALKASPATATQVKR